MGGVVYILYSKNLDRYYIGSTKDINQRIEFHIGKVFKLNFTKRSEDWELYHSISTKNISVAIKIESHIKRMKSRKYIEDLKKYPNMSQKLIEKYSN